MTDSDDAQTSQLPSPSHRVTRDVDGEEIDLRQPEDEDGIFEIRMPIATTGEVRNHGDEPLTRDELSGMARQINDNSVPVFLDHGDGEIGGARYSAVGKIGEWTNAELNEREVDDNSEIVASARLMDPETLPAAAESLREPLAAIREQVRRDISQSASIGWREDESSPGGNDLMEASIVGIPADPRTTSDSPVAAVARAAVDAGADPDALVSAVRDAVDSERPLGPPEDPDRFETFDECVAALQDDEDLSEEEAERICGSWEDAKDEQSMTDKSDASAEEADAEQDDQPDESRQDMERLIEMQEKQLETLQRIEERVTDDDEMEDDEDEEADEDEEQSVEESADESEPEPGDAQALREEMSAMRDELNDLRDGGLNQDAVDSEPTDTQEVEEATDDSSNMSWTKYA
jgi:hypothetical protein